MYFFWSLALPAHNNRKKKSLHLLWNPQFRGMTKTPPKKVASKDKSKVTATGDTLVIALSAAQKARAKKCIERSGAVRFTIQEIKLNHLLGTVRAEVISD